MTIRELLLDAARTFSESDTPLLDAVILLAHSLNVPKEKILAMLPEEACDVPPAFFEMADRRRRGESIAHIRGFREFYGRTFLVTDDVLSPRQDTEILVEAVLETGDRFAMIQNASPHASKPLKVLDLCTGAGAVAITLAAERPAWHVTASDISLKALEIAQQNAHRLLSLPSAVEFIASDLFSGISGQFDIIASNPPYVPRAQAEQLIAEGWKDPLLALDGGTDGMDFVRAIIAQASEFLCKNGVVLLEMDPSQVREAVALFKQAGFCEIRIWKDLAGRERVAGGRYG
jgi:release factor glutamine methyltransferase